MTRRQNNPRFQRNFIHRQAAPSRDRGRVQRQARIALWWHDGVITTAQALAWTHGRRLLGEEAPLRHLPNGAPGPIGNRDPDRSSPWIGTPYDLAGAQP
jgi:hypothetical protein